MSLSCPPPPLNKKEYLSDIGQILVMEHGKKEYYTPDEVKKAHKKSHWSEGVDFSCWAMSTFSSSEDFTHHHLQSGEQCDYTEMKTQMLHGLSVTNTLTGAELPADSNTSWWDIGVVFDAISDGLGDLISGISDSL
jgi:hypothetical protein